MQTGVEERIRLAMAKLTDKGIEKISVSALCEKAGISRASFYIYYKDMDDLIKKTRLYIINKLDEQLKLLLDVKDLSEFDERSVIFDKTDISLLPGIHG